MGTGRGIALGLAKGFGDFVETYSDEKKKNRRANILKNIMSGGDIDPSQYGDMDLDTYKDILDTRKKKQSIQENKRERQEDIQEQKEEQMSKMGQQIMQNYLQKGGQLSKADILATQLRVPQEERQDILEQQARQRLGGSRAKAAAYKRRKAMFAPKTKTTPMMARIQGQGAKEAGYAGYRSPGKLFDTPKDTKEETSQNIDDLLNEVMGGDTQATTGSNPRQQAIELLKSRGERTTEENINYVVNQLGR